MSELPPKTTPAQLDHQRELTRRGESAFPSSLEYERLEVAEDFGKQVKSKARRFPAGS